MDRRQFIESTIAGSLISSLAGSPHARAAKSKRRPRILLRSSWQTMNIGDIAHTPGVLSLLEQYLPDAEVVLWPSRVDNGVDKILTKRFPGLTIAQDSHSQREAMKTCDFLLHGSGPSLVAERFVESWVQQTGKPYGVYGIGLPARKHQSTADEPAEAMARTVGILSGAQFAFFRETKSLELAKSLGCRCPVMDFAPDGAFACDLRDDKKANTFLSQHQLEPGQFLCCIPRYRYTPNWTIPEKNRPFNPEHHARNEAMKEHDHAQLRESIIQIVEQTDLKILLCPEDRTQMALGKEMILDKLSAKTLDRVVWRPNYWLTGEAVSTYVLSSGLFGNEMHSPIMAIGHGVPAIVCRFAEQTTKGYMWDDIGLNDWLFDLDIEAEVQQIVPTVLQMAKDPRSARETAAHARKFVQQRQRETMLVVAETLANV